MSPTPRTDRQAWFAWAGPLQQAVADHLQHDAAGLADPGTESVLAQVLAAPSRHHTGYPATAQEHTAMQQPSPHHVPAAFTPSRDTPPPIPFPARPANARTERPSDSTRARWAQMERTAKAIDAARDAGRAEGERAGDKRGWRRGALQGAVAAALLVSLAWSAYLSYAAPEVAPPSAVRPLVQPRT